MKNLIRRSLAAISTAAVLTAGALTPAKAAYNFGETNINQNDVVAVAQPLNMAGRQTYKLLIFQQQSNARDCWSESGYGPVSVDPLLLNFNFSGICGRATDSNGYSARVNDRDLGLTHNLSLQNVGGEVRLYAVSSGEKILIGRTQGLTGGFMKIMLQPGWRFTKRTYNGQVLGHFYLSNDNYYASQPEPAPPAPRTYEKPTPQPPTYERPAPQPRRNNEPTSPGGVDRSDLNAWKSYIEMLLKSIR